VIVPECCDDCIIVVVIVVVVVRGTSSRASRGEGRVIGTMSGSVGTGRHARFAREVIGFRGRVGGGGDGHCDGVCFVGCRVGVVGVR